LIAGSYVADVMVAVEGEESGAVARDHGFGTDSQRFQKPPLNTPAPVQLEPSNVRDIQAWTDEAISPKAALCVSQRLPVIPDCAVCDLSAHQPYRSDKKHPRHEH
jgi:hypothetical protein